MKGLFKEVAQSIGLARLESIAFKLFTKGEAEGEVLEYEVARGDAAGYLEMCDDFSETIDQKLQDNKTANFLIEVEPSAEASPHDALEARPQHVAEKSKEKHRV